MRTFCHRQLPYRLQLWAAVVCVEVVVEEEVCVVTTTVHFPTRTVIAEVSMTEWENMTPWENTTIWESTKTWENTTLWGSMTIWENTITWENMTIWANTTGCTCPIPLWPTTKLIQIQE